jgi:hypothetical protein
MSNRNISENLEYFVDNEGLHYSAPIIDLITPNATLNGQPIVSGTVTSSNSVTVGASPARIIDTYYPKSLYTTVTANLVANTPLAIDWTTRVDTQDTFPLAPSPGASNAFVIPVPASPTQWQFLVGGNWATQFTATPTVTLGNTQELKYIIERSFNGGGVWTPIQTEKLEKNGAGTPSVDSIGGHMCYNYIDPAFINGTERVRITMTCTENKTVDLRLYWILLGRD